MTALRANGMTIRLAVTYEPLGKKKVHLKKVYDMRYNTIQRTNIKKKIKNSL